MKKDKLKNNLVNIIKQIGKHDHGQWVFNIDKLLSKWEKSHPNRKFKNFGFGCLKPFLVKELGVCDLDSGDFSFSESSISDETNKKNDGNSDFKEVPAEAFWPNDGASSCQEHQTEEYEALKFDMILIIRELSQKDVRTGSYKISLELIWRSVKEQQFGIRFATCEELKRFLLNHCYAEFKEIKQVDSDEVEIFSFEEKAIKGYLKSRGVGEELSIQVQQIHQPESEQDFPLEINVPATATSIRPPIPSESEDKPNTAPQNPKIRFMQVVCILYDCGLDALRDVFMRLHPGWKNCAWDTRNFKFGSLRVDEYEKEAFESGNIDRWDITLICKVLLFSEISSTQLKTTAYNGYEKAIKSLRDLKNNIISHNNNPQLTEMKYKEAMNEMQISLTAIGFPKKKYMCALEDTDVSVDNLFYKMYLEEVARSLSNQIEAGNKSFSNQLETGNKNLSKEVNKVKKSVDSIRNEIKDHNELINRILSKEIHQHEIPSHAIKQGPADWDEWMKVKTELNNFDTDSNQYILIVDKLLSSDVQYLTALGKVPWKIVLDLDADSDNDGLLNNISSSGENSCLIVTHTPSQLPNRMIDHKRVQWVFANGRNRDTEEDAPKKNFKDWRQCFLTPVSNLINKFSLKLDATKPIFCVVLNLQNASMKIAKSLVEDIDSKFSFKKFRLKFVFFSPEFDLEDYTNSCYSNLSSKFLFLGINAQLGQVNDKYQLPSAQEGVLVPLRNKKYQFLSECLEILYKGCENIPEELPGKEKEKFKKDHLISFLKGNLISFESLQYGHDCKRSITEQIKNRIHKIWSRSSTSQIVQISHSPGTGGSTIARRILWDLHPDYPCAIVKMVQANDNFAAECEGEQFVTNLSDRIRELEDTCELKPVILIDGNSRQVRNLSDHLVRKLNADGRQAIILRVVYPGNKRENDSYLQQKSNFELKSVLEDNEHDLDSFRKTYQYYYKLLDQPKRQTREIYTLTRVFHFPMMAMLGDFSKLEEIVKESLDIVKSGHANEYEIAVLVAFLQIYADWETPISLIEKYLKTKLLANQETKQKFSNNLLCLMVSKKAPRKMKWIGYKSYKTQHEADYDDDEDEYEEDGTDFDSLDQGLEWCTFQHQNVAKIVLEHCQQHLDDITSDFVNSVLEENSNQSRFRILINDLFLYNKEKSDDHFSRLVMKLESGGRIFEEAAKKTKDAAFYSHVARYFAMQKTPPDFKKARALIREGLAVDKFASKDKTRGVRDAEGHILLREMKAVRAKNLKTVEELENYAKEAISCFRKARDNPPMTYPNPLTGEVNVWQFCFDWIIKWKKGDVEAAVAYMMEEEFFQTAIADCFYLLDQIDVIVQSVPWLIDPTFTMVLANESRLSLMQVLGRTKGKTGRQASIQSLDIARLCEEICSKRNFKNADEKEITRLRVSWMWNQAGKDIHLLHEANRPVLLRLLEKLVKRHCAYEYAQNLITVSTIQKDDNSYTLEKALEIVKEWQIRTPYDAFAFFFDYIICFLHVINGSIFAYRSPYRVALDACIKRCESNHRKYLKRYYIANGRNTEKMCCLISPSELEKLCNEERSAKQKQKPVDHHPERKHLFVCHGRIRLQKNVRGKEYPVIVLEQGGLKIGIGKNTLGIPHQDYTPDSKVVFSVYFTLDGPKAKDIRCENPVASAAKISRQTSKGK